MEDTCDAGYGMGGSNHLLNAAGFPESCLTPSPYTSSSLCYPSNIQLSIKPDTENGKHLLDDQLLPDMVCATVGDDWLLPYYHCYNPKEDQAIQ